VKHIAQDDAHAQLAAKRAELKEAEIALTAADASMDTDAVMNLTQRVGVLRQFVGKLETESTATSEREAESRARTWLESHADAVASVSERITVAQTVVRGHIEAAVKAIAEEAALRKSVEAGVTAVEILTARFALPVPAATIAVPPVEDWASRVLPGTDSMRPSRSTRRRMLVTRVASDSPERIRRATLNAVAEFVDKHGKTLPAEVLAILAAAPIPADALDSPREATSGERHFADELARSVADTKRALAAVPAGFRGGV